MVLLGFYMKRPMSLCVSMYDVLCVLRVEWHDCLEVVHRQLTKIQLIHTLPTNTHHTQSINTVLQYM
jgi:hypothetical protein